MRSLFFDTQIMKKLGATAQAKGHAANDVIDGDPNTFVIAGDPKAVSREEVEIVINFPSARGYVRAGTYATAKSSGA